MGFRVSDPTKIGKSVAPSDTTDQHSNGELECDVSRVATSKPKKNRKSKHGPNEMHASKHAIKRSKRGALVDRGANGGMLGSDAKVIFNRNKMADVTGIDNHELNALPMVDATATLLQMRDLLSLSYGTVLTMVSTKHCTQLDRLNGTRTKHATHL